MAEFSYWWTTSGTPSGDQVSSYTQAHLGSISQVLGGMRGSEGVNLTDLNGTLAGTVTAANTVQISAGSAIVDGKPYTNSSAVNVNIPSAVGGGNTRIDRIVLRASWSAYTVRITRIAGTDAASPTAPALTQTSGTTYDTPLYQALVDTAGTVTLTDERETHDLVVDSTLDWTSGLLKVADGGIDTTQLAADSVDDTKVGDRVPQLYRREGGHATNWGTSGTTSYTPGAVRVQVGAIGWTGSAASSGSIVVSYPVAFSGTAIFLAGSLSGGAIVANPSGPSASAVTLNWTDTVGNLRTTVNFAWIAIGPE